MYKLDGSTTTLLYDLKEGTEIVSPEDYDLTITGDVQNNDTITLTYNTVPAYVVSRDSAYVVEQGSESPSGTAYYRYRKWSDGTLEQWIHYPSDAGGATALVVQIPKAYKNKQWFCAASESDDTLTSTDTQGAAYSLFTSDKEAGSIRVSRYTSRPFTLYCCGIGASS